MTFEDWGLIEYEASVARQMELVERMSISQSAQECVVICSHPAIVTLGRASTAEDLGEWAGAIAESSRGGRATYHGPSQVVIYPILNLKNPRANVGERDVHSYLRALGEATVRALRGLGLERAEARTSSIASPGEKSSLTGVWIGEKKIASIGIAIRKWVTYHGVAINIHDDGTAFSGIRPCGFDASIMTSLERELGMKADHELARTICREAFVSYLL